MESLKRIDPRVYWTRAYNTKERTCSYWHQVDEILSLGAGTVLEVGPGPGIVTSWLRVAGLTVTTLDREPATRPDLTGSVTAIPAEDDSFDAVLCSQVLEHMPLETAGRALAEMRRVSRLGAVVSLPDTRPYVGTSYPLYYGYYMKLVRDNMPRTRLTRLRALLSGKLRLRDYLFVRFIPAEWGLGGKTLELSIRRFLTAPRGFRSLIGARVRDWNGRVSARTDSRDFLGRWLAGEPELSGAGEPLAPLFRLAAVARMRLIPDLVSALWQNRPSGSSAELDSPLTISTPVARTLIRGVGYGSRGDPPKSRNEAVAACFRPMLGAAPMSSGVVAMDHSWSTSTAG